MPSVYTGSHPQPNQMPLLKEFRFNLKLILKTVLYFQTSTDEFRIYGMRTEAHLQLSPCFMAHTEL